VTSRESTALVAAASDGALIPMDVIRWAADECERQQSGEQSVVWMLNGWLFAVKRSAGLVSREDVLHLAGVVEPRHNTGRGFRRVNVRVGFGVKGSWRSVPRQMANLIDARERLTPDEWYREYEEIHPFKDGNGRTGSILWNWMRGTVLSPEAPPDFWGSP
jgi:Fic/DOC family protein